MLIFKEALQFLVIYSITWIYFPFTAANHLPRFSRFSNIDDEMEEFNPINAQKQPFKRDAATNQVGSFDAISFFDTENEHEELRRFNRFVDSKPRIQELEKFFKLKKEEKLKTKAQSVAAPTTIYTTTATTTTTNRPVTTVAPKFDTFYVTGAKEPSENIRNKKPFKSIPALEATTVRKFKLNLPHYVIPSSRLRFELKSDEEIPETNYDGEDFKKETEDIETQIPIWDSEEGITRSYADDESGPPFAITGEDYYSRRSHPGPTTIYVNSNSQLISYLSSFYNHDTKSHQDTEHEDSSKASLSTYIFPQGSGMTQEQENKFEKRHPVQRRRPPLATSKKFKRSDATNAIDMGDPWEMRRTSPRIFKESSPEKDRRRYVCSLNTVDGRKSCSSNCAQRRSSMICSGPYCYCSTLSTSKDDGGSTKIENNSGTCGPNTEFGRTTCRIVCNDPSDIVHCSQTTCFCNQHRNVDKGDPVIDQMGRPIFEILGEYFYCGPANGRNTCSKVCKGWGHVTCGEISCYCDRGGS